MPLSDLLGRREIFCQKKCQKNSLFWARTFRSDVHEVNDNGKVPFVALSLPILRSVTKSQCQSAILTKRKVTMRKQKLNGKLLFATLFILHRCKRKQKQNDKQVAVQCPASIAAKKEGKQAKQTKNKKGNKEHTGKLLAVTLSSLHLCKKENKQKSKKTSKATKSRMANYLP